MKLEEILFFEVNTYHSYSRNQKNQELFPIPFAPWVRGLDVGLTSQMHQHWICNMEKRKGRKKREFWLLRQPYQDPGKCFLNLHQHCLCELWHSSYWASVGIRFWLLSHCVAFFYSCPFLADSSNLPGLSTY